MLWRVVMLGAATWAELSTDGWSIIDVVDCLEAYELKSRIEELSFENNEDQ